MRPDDFIKRRAKKVVDAGMSIPLANLAEQMDTNDKLNILISKEVVFPEIPEFPNEITISNLPETQKVEVINPVEIQKVEITNLPEEKNNKEELQLLKEIASELKKKEDYAYDIEIDSALKEQLKGEKGEDGKNGNEIEPKEVVSKLESLEGEERLDISAVRGVEATVESIAKYVFKEEIKDIKKVYVSGSSSSSSGGISESFETVSANLDSSDATLNYDVDGNITSIDYANGITKTFNYTGEDITSIVLSGSTPSGITLTKTLTYTDGDVVNIAYS